MIITALTWAALLLTSALALGCAIAIIMMVIGIVCNIGKGREKRDAEMCVIFAIIVACESPVNIEKHDGVRLLKQFPYFVHHCYSPTSFTVFISCLTALRNFPNTSEERILRLDVFMHG